MQIELTDEQSSQLRLLLQDALGDLSAEIAGTDNSHFREGLRSRRVALGAVLQQLGDSAGGNA
jgi:hypothetical protein